MYHRRHRASSQSRVRRWTDGLLASVCLLGSLFALQPIATEALVARHSEQVITSLSSSVNETHDKTRMGLLEQAQAYNRAQGAGGPHNVGLRGNNEGREDILELDDGTVEPNPYETQLHREASSAMCWLEVPAIGVREPVYHGTDDDTLAAGVGHLAWSSLPVGGRSTHCVLAAHSGMPRSSMFDDLESLTAGDILILHTLGDAYAYQVFEKEIVLPEEAREHCQIVADEDLCTLVTCTPYGINSHRLLVHARRCPYAARATRPRATMTRITSRRSLPATALGAGMALIACSLWTMRLRARRQRGRDPRLPRSRDVSRNGNGPRPPRRCVIAWRMWIALSLGMAVLLAAAGIWVAAVQKRDNSRYAQLADTSVRPGSIRDGDVTGDRAEASRDWSALAAANPDVVAWVEVEQTSISLPVVAPRDGDMTYYLHHDFWRDDSLLGTPFLDHRCRAAGVHRLVYGHHLTSGGQFSELQRAYRQEVFDGLGNCFWEMPDKASSTLFPLCALCTDQDDAAIQQFSFADDAALRNWLAELCHRATATASDHGRAIAEAREVVTLVTCSSDLSNQRWRTLVVFVGP